MSWKDNNEYRINWTGYSGGIYILAANKDEAIRTAWKIWKEEFKRKISFNEFRRTKLGGIILWKTWSKSGKVKYPKKHLKF